VLVPDRYDDGGFSGGTLERPALKRLLADIEVGRVDVVVVYKMLDRLTAAEHALMMRSPRMLRRRELRVARERSFILVSWEQATVRQAPG
jgi:DNA invertase Pin-like site-specific DNA recombinase